MIFYWFFLAFILSALLTDRFCQPQSTLCILDEPNARSLHQFPRSRTGGVAILFSLYLTAACAFSSIDLPLPLHRLAFATLLITVVSFLDDCQGTPVFIRLLCHFAAAGLLVSSFPQLPDFELPGWYWAWSPTWALCLITLFIAWMTNLCNFMDGMDGFVSGITIIGLSAFAFMGWRADHESYTLLNLIVVASTLGFWCFNYPRAYIFMGDIGACTLGFITAFLGVWGCVEGIFRPWFALLVFSPLIMDATVTLLLRILRLEPVWIPQRNHFYHKLLLRLGHLRAVWIEYTLMILCTLSAVLNVNSSTQQLQVLLITWCILYTLFFCSISLFARFFPQLESMQSLDRPQSVQ